MDYLERLFAAPFATLTAEQREAVETWCPPGMEIETPRILEPIEGDDPLRTPSVDGEDNDPDMDMPEESVDAGEDDAVPGGRGRLIRPSAARAAPPERDRGGFLSWEFNAPPKGRTP